MPKTHPPYADEFRQQMRELAQTGRTPAQLSREFGVTAQTIANRIAQANRRGARCKEVIVDRQTPHFGAMPVSEARAEISIQLPSGSFTKP